MVLAPPAADPSSPWMQHLERAHRLAHEAARTIEEQSEPSAHLGPAAAQIGRSVAAMYDAFDGRDDRATSIARANARLWDAAVSVARAGFPRALASLRRACSELASAEERLPRLAVAGRTQALLTAGDDRPPLHTVERPSLSPRFRAPPLLVPLEGSPDGGLELAEPTTFEELAAAAEAVRDAVAERAKTLVRLSPKRREATEAAALKEEAPPGFAFAPPVAEPEEAFVRRWARECFDEIGMLGLSRAPLVGDDWRSCQALERRMVRAIDALAALGPSALAEVEPLAKDAPAADPMRVFAAAMVAGCLEGRDVVGGAERVLHRFGAGDPVVAEAFCAAMKLAQNPLVGGAMRGLLASEEGAARAIGAEVLAYRGELDGSELSTLADDEDPEVFSHVLRPLAETRHAALEAALDRALGHPDGRVQEAALDAMARASHTSAAKAAREAVAGDLGERALVRLALVGDEDDAKALVARLRANPTRAAIEAAGWAGHLEAVPSLIGVLASEDAGEEEKRAAGEALERLLGAKLVETIVVAPEALDEVTVPDPEAVAKGEPPPKKTLAELLSDARDEPSAGSNEELEVAAMDPARWRAYFAEHGKKLDSAVRTRRGQAHSPSVALFELDRLGLSQEDRRRLHRELSFRTGRTTRFDPHDFVVVQEEGLTAWEGIVRKAGVMGGRGWGRCGG